MVTDTEAAARHRARQRASEPRIPPPRRSYAGIARNSVMPHDPVIIEEYNSGEPGIMITRAKLFPAWIPEKPTTPDAPDSDTPASDRDSGQ